LLVLPLALPGLLTGIALSTSFTFVGLSPSMWTIVIGHATFCVVIVYNNVVARLRRSSPSLIEASQDLGGRSWRTFRSVIFPLALPGIVAGSIFTFSLTLGDFITPALVGGANSQFIGNVVHNYVGISNNVPLAAAFALVPVIVMAVYLFVAKRLGAFEAL